MNAKSTILIIPQLKCNISATKYSINSNLGFKNISFFFGPITQLVGSSSRTGIEPGPLQVIDLQGISINIFTPYGAPNHRVLREGDGTNDHFL